MTMTDFALRAPAVPAALWSALCGTVHAMLSTGRLSLRAWIAAPLLIAIPVLPEFAQHVAEISLGMFTSREGFAAGANDPLRWMFAYPKIAGFVLGILFVARFLALGSVRSALRVRPVTLLKTGFTILLAIAAEQPFLWAAEATSSPILDTAFRLASMVLQAGLLVYLVAVVLEDRTVSLKGALLGRLPTALLIVLLAAAVFVPTQWLHQLHHQVAIGQAPSLVWSLMIWDSLWVGLMASLLGASLYVAFRAGPTFRGWSADPRGIA